MRVLFLRNVNYENEIDTKRRNKLYIFSIGIKSKRFKRDIRIVLIDLTDSLVAV